MSQRHGAHIGGLHSRVCTDGVVLQALHPRPELSQVHGESIPASRIGCSTIDAVRQVASLWLLDVLNLVFYIGSSKHDYSLEGNVCERWSCAVWILVVQKTTNSANLPW